MALEFDRMTVRQRRWFSRLWIVVVVLVGSTTVAVPSVRIQVLRQAGWALVSDDPVDPADVVVISVDAGGAGVLEAADLVDRGIATRVAVLADRETEEDREFVRRGMPDQDVAHRSVRQLISLGVLEAERIARPVSGTTDVGRMLVDWCDERGFDSVVVVTRSSHSRRLRRVLRRATRDGELKVMVRVSSYSDFDPDRWWETRSGIRTAIVELQKLLLDVVAHPIPMLGYRLPRGSHPRAPPRS
jgi:hypothetical protein